MITRLALLIASVLALMTPTQAFAQAWAGDKGTLNLSLSSAFHFSDAVYYGDIKITDLSTQSFSNTLGGEFSPIDRLTLGLDFTYMSNKYTGPTMGASEDIVLPHGSQDDGNWNGDLQDMNINARYQLTTDPVAFSPILNIRIPVKDYEQQGYANTGNGLKEVSLGVFLGRAGIGLEGLFAEGGYLFNYVEKLNEGPLVEDISTHYSLLRATVGYFLGSRFTASVGYEMRQPHGGVELSEYRDLDPEIQEWHDPIMARQYHSVNAMASYMLTDELGLGLGFATVLSGDNVSDAKAIGLNLSWSHMLYEEEVEPEEPADFDPEEGEDDSSDEFDPDADDSDEF